MNPFASSNSAPVQVGSLPRKQRLSRQATETSAPEILTLNQPIKPRIRSIWIVQDNTLVQQRIKA